MTREAGQRIADRPLHEVHTRVDGRDIRATFEVRDGCVIVASVYGTRSARCGGINERQLAILTLKDILTFQKFS
jgi:hypothetical protein